MVSVVCAAIVLLTTVDIVWLSFCCRDSAKPCTVIFTGTVGTSVEPQGLPYRAAALTFLHGKMHYKMHVYSELLSCRSRDLF